MGTSKILIDGVGIDLTQDTVAANKMLSGTKAHDSNGDSATGSIQTWDGTQKSGTKNIAANGTYDVSEFASANVAVPIGAANIKRFEVTIAAQFTGTTMNLISGDTDVAAHFADSTAFCFLLKKESANMVYRDMAALFNSNINASITGAYFRKTSSGAFDVSNGTAQKLSGAPASADNCIFANSRGDIEAKCVASYSTLASGDYYILFGW